MTKMFTSSLANILTWVSRGILLLAAIAGSLSNADAQTLPGSGKALTFSGFGNYINAGAGNRNITQQVTVEAWIKTSTSNYQFVLGKYSDGSGQDKGYHLVTNGGRAGFHGRAGVGQYFTSGLSVTRVDDGRWHHLAGVCTGSTWQVYVDGILEGSTTYNYTNGNLASSVPMAIGMYYLANDQFFNGQMDEVRVWNSARTEAHIRTDMCRRFATIPGNLVAYYRFDQSSGQVANDEGSVPANGSLVGFSGNPWVTSGAAIGDASVAGYPSAGINVARMWLFAANRDSAVVTNVNAQNKGIHLYAVNSTPQVSPGTGTAPSYFGVFSVPATSSYTVRLSPESGTVPASGLYTRTANDALAWNTTSPTVTASTLVLDNQTYRNEYIMTGRTLATASAQLSAQVSVYPNPAHRTVWVQLPASASQQSVVTIYNTLGQQLLTQKLIDSRAAQQLPLPALAKGVYTVRIALAEGTVTKRLVIE
ncbi:T9SS type A sorting domain-containing protein [Hymenobacter busanensis]|uniref:T9SS type A sorting domain-containing protein n=1 Tax=Hymenobacter busanensis TaxID=2607656 RepID=A0A7L4ZUZ8_9BACT|nr:LamG-like jellyroll fold domain-containing protein [Hymenobacter busanensis]KAA9339459.1 T9SS type A sorting domain-containing protein [Hymenobacter busanensis]QHJ06783.1 T9SS type A sorting domain-containing protein [Hymenobacter busanensis]